MRMGQGVRTGLGQGGITCVLQTQFSSFFFFFTTGYGFCVINSIQISIQIWMCGHIENVHVDNDARVSFDRNTF